MSWSVGHLKVVLGVLCLSCGSAIAQQPAVQLQTKSGVDPMAKQLMIEAELGAIDNVLWHLNRQVTVDGVIQGMTPLMAASAGGHIPVIRLLKQRGANINATAGKAAQENDGFTPLMIAAQRGHLAVVQELLVLGAEVNTKTPTGITAISAAQYLGRRPIVAALAAAGADVNAATSDGMTPLMMAAFNHHVESMRELLARGANVNAKDLGGDTALIHAARQCRTEAVRLLVSAGADREINTRGACVEVIGLLGR